MSTKVANTTTATNQSNPKLEKELTEDTISDMSSDGIENEGVEASEVGADKILDEESGSSEGVMKQAFGFIKNHLKVGADMTKLPIPATFVAPLSFLAAQQHQSAIYSHVLMQADSIKDPEQRFLQVLKYHMTWPKMFFPKNPLNPILGEVHESHVLNVDEKTNETIKDDKTVFIAEQVSHHPPISCFHFHNDKHGITFESKQQITPVFKGKHIRATMDVKNVITLKNHNETYINEKFPEGYLRLLRWKFEFCGKYGFVCPETGYSAQINFKDKPLIGSQWHTVNVQVFKGTELIYDITGTHVDTLNITNVKDKSTSVFINYNTMRQDTVTEKPFEQLKDNESIRVWKGVADAFAKKDGRRAGLEKQKVEEAQRKKAKAHQNHVHVPAYFQFYTPENVNKPDIHFILPATQQDQSSTVTPQE
ncbi:oxysterol binding family protein [Cavenderia fasciculata]|uniref:Oxysterol binding family protein n=1 Tax=Cavenderia fasciculata TaxID=261658 RepID=F4PXX5_CACFS|nr:oxysterol binding family protein [Cavenderia fasciculata]EGG19635.1 oxysterol binding family protein [Cavenderia fasciculata]|eukprot:XP_004357929.1 oxysterol binding family protein [Cavenderia fasciculata]